MDEQRLVEIEADHNECCPILHVEDGSASLRQVGRAIRADDINGDHCDIVELLAEVRHLRDALNWYADPAVWEFGSGMREGQPVTLDPVAVHDGGHRARQALSREADDGTDC